MKAASVVVLLAAAVTLGGCSAPTAQRPPASHPVSTASSASSARPTSSADPGSDEAALPSDAIIRITATATARTGEVAKLVETVLAPVAGDGSEDATMSNAGCDGWQAQFPHPSWTHVSVAATLLSGSSWPSDDAILTLSGTALGYSVWSGAWRTFQAPCSDGIQVIPGAAVAIVPADAGAAALTATSATGGPFGFTFANDSGDPSDMHFLFTGCTIEAGPAAGAAASHFTRAPAGGGFPAMCTTP